MTHYFYAALYTITVFVKCSNCTSVSNGSFVDMNGQPVGKDTSVDGSITHSVNQTAGSQNSYMGYGQTYLPVYQEHDQSLMQTGSNNMLYYSNIGSGHNTGVGLPSSYLSPKSNKKCIQSAYSMQPVAAGENGIPSYQTTSDYINPNTETSSQFKSMDPNVTYASHGQNLYMQRPENTKLPQTQNQTNDTLQACKIEQIIAEILDFHKKRCLEIPPISNFDQEISNSASILQQTDANSISQDLESRLSTTNANIGQTSAGQTYLASSLPAKRLIGVDQQDNNPTKKPKLSQATSRSDMGNKEQATIHNGTNIKQNQTQAETLGISREKSQGRETSYISFSEFVKKFQQYQNEPRRDLSGINFDFVVFSRNLSENEQQSGDISKKLYLPYIISVSSYHIENLEAIDIISMAGAKAQIKINFPTADTFSSTKILSDSKNFLVDFKNLQQQHQNLEDDCDSYCENITNATSIEEMRKLFVQFLLAYVLDKKDNERYTLKPDLWKLQCYMVEIRPYFYWRLSMIQDPINQTNLSCHDYTKEIGLIKNLLIDYYSDYPAMEKYIKSLRNMGSVHKYRRYILDLLSTDQYKHCLEYSLYQNTFYACKRGIKITSATLKRNFMYMLAFTPYLTQIDNFTLENAEEGTKSIEAGTERTNGKENKIWKFMVDKIRSKFWQNKQLLEIFVCLVNDVIRIKENQPVSTDELTFFIPLHNAVWVIKPKFGNDFVEITALTRLQMISYFHNLIYRLYMGEMLVEEN